MAVFLGIKIKKVMMQKIPNLEKSGIFYELYFYH